MMSTIADRLKPFQFTKETAKVMQLRSALARRKSPLDKIDVLLLENEDEIGARKFKESRLRRVRKQLILIDMAFERETRRYKPDTTEINRLIIAQDRLWDLERKLSGQPVQPKSSGDPVKSDIPDV